MEKTKRSDEMIKQACCWKEDKLSLCPSLSSRLGESKGLVFIKVINLKTGIERELGIAYKTDAKDRGLLINFCPFCGGNINPRIYEGNVK
jgi:hypothetical protein